VCAAGMLSNNRGWIWLRMNSLTIGRKAKQGSTALKYLVFKALLVLSD